MAALVACALAAFVTASPVHAAQTDAGAGMSKAWPWPLIGEIATAYRNGSDPYAAGQHRGVDIAAPVGTPARAVASGTIVFSGKLPDGGNTVTLRTADGEHLVSYLHLLERAVRRGASVSVGETLGTVGMTGKRSIEPSHLHLGVRIAATRQYVDPMGLLGEPALAAPLAVAPRAEQQISKPERAESRAVKVVPLEADVEARSSSPTEVPAIAPLEARSNSATAAKAPHASTGDRADSGTIQAPAPVEIDEASTARATTQGQAPERRSAPASVVAPTSAGTEVPVRAVLFSLAALAFAALFINRRPRRTPESSQPPAGDTALQHPTAEVVELSAAAVRSR